MAKYILGDKEVTEEEFYKTVFFLDKVIGAPSWDKCLGIEDITKIILAEDAYDFKLSVSGSTHHTGGTVFEKVQDSTSPNYSVVIENCNKAQENYLRNHLINQTEQQKEVLDNYNSIVGQSTKAKEIKAEDIWNENKRKAVSQAIIKDLRSYDPEQREKAKELSDKYKAEDKVGIKENAGKLHYELSWEFIEEMAKRMANNKSDKYPLYNWKKPLDVKDLKDAINRHHIEVMKGNYQDGDEILGHIVSYACNSMMLWEQLRNKK